MVCFYCQWRKQKLPNCQKSNYKNFIHLSEKLDVLKSLCYTKQVRKLVPETKQQKVADDEL